MKNTRRIIKGIIISVFTLAVGFTAISVPFGLIGNLSSEGMQALFIGEIIVYFVSAMTYLTVREKKRAERARNEVRRFQKRAKFEQAQREYYDLAA